MKKVLLTVVSILIVMTMLLSACVQEVEPTAEPMVEEEAVVEEEVVEEEPTEAVVEEAEEEMVEEETKEVEVTAEEDKELDDPASVNVSVGDAALQKTITELTARLEDTEAKLKKAEEKVTPAKLDEAVEKRMDFIKEVETLTICFGDIEI